MDINEHSKKVKEAVNTTCTNKLGPKKIVHKDWVNTDSLKKIKARREIKEHINASKPEAERRAAMLILRKWQILILFLVYNLVYPG